MPGSPDIIQIMASGTPKQLDLSNHVLIDRNGSILCCIMNQALHSIMNFISIQILYTDVLCYLYMYMYMCHSELV